MRPAETRAAGRHILEALDRSALSPSVRLTLRVVALRMIRHPQQPLLGAESIAAAIDRQSGWRPHVRTVQRALAYARATGYLVTVCCGFGVCLGGRGHAAVAAPGPTLVGVIAAGARLLFRKKGDILRVATGSLTTPLPPREEEERRNRRNLMGMDGGRGDPQPPPPPLEGPAPPAEVIEGAGGRYSRLLADIPRDLFAR